MHPNPSTPPRDVLWSRIDPELIARLNDRQRAFARAYLGEARWNATRSASIAGYAWPRQQGPRLTSFPAVKAVIEAGVKAYLAWGEGR